MTIQDIAKKNDQFQSQALGLTELIPKADMLEFATLLKRKAAQIHHLFSQLLHIQNTNSFWVTYESMDDVMEELVYELDRLHDLNCVMQIRPVDDFIKGGYDLLSVYSISSDQVVKMRNQTKAKA